MILRRPNRWASTEKAPGPSKTIAAAMTATSRDGMVAGDCTAVECGKPGKPSAGHDEEGNDRNDRSKKAGQQRQSAKEREHAHRHDGDPQDPGAARGSRHGG